MQAKSGVGEKIIVSVLHCIFGKHVVKKEIFLLFTQGWVGVLSKLNCFVEDIFDSKTVPKRANFGASPICFQTLSGEQRTQTIEFKT